MTSAAPAVWWQRLVPPHRALGVPPATDRRTWALVAERPAARAVVDAARAASDPRRLSAEDWLRFHRTGDRTHHEGIVAERHARLSLDVVAAAITREQGFVDAVVEGVWGWCELSSWCWPAHDDAKAASGSPLPDPDRPFLDLGAGEVAAQLAWTDHVVGDLLDSRAPGLRRRIRQEVRRRVTEPFVDRDDWHWWRAGARVHNWLPWICSNVLVAALALEDDVETRAGVVVRAVDGLGRFVEALPPDGAIDEGFGYWWNGAGRTLEALEVLDRAVDGALPAWTNDPRLRATTAFPALVHLGRDWFVNVADSSARPDSDLAWPSLFRAAERFGDGAARALALSHRDPHTAVSEYRRLGRLLTELTDDGWWGAPSPEAGDWRDEWLPSIQLLVGHAESGVAPRMTLVAKGGHNDENHNHNDVGSFIVALDGVPVVIDVGRPTYDARTFGPGRYDIWTMQSAWHNVPVVRGEQQSPGADRRARDVRADTTDAHVALELDLQQAYPCPGLLSWRRRVLLDKTEVAVRLHDRWEFADRSSLANRATLVVAGAVRPVDEGIVVTPLGGGARLRIDLDHPFQVERKVLDDPMLTDVWGSEVHRITIDLGCENVGESAVVFTVDGEVGP